MIGFLRLIAGLSSGHVGYGARRTALLALQTAPVLPSCKDNNGQSRPVTEHRPLAWGQQVLRSKFFRVITGFKFLAPCIANRASKSVTGRISRYRCRRCAVSCSKRTVLTQG